MSNTYFRALKMSLLKDLTPSERPRERMIEHGAAALTPAELLAIVLCSGTRGQSAIGLAHHLLETFGGLRPLLVCVGWATPKPAN